MDWLLLLVLLVPGLTAAALFLLLTDRDSQRDLDAPEGGVRPP